MRLRQQNRQSPTPQKKPNTEQQTTQQTFSEHLSEVRNRLFWVALVLVVASVIGLQLKDQVTAIVMSPLHGQKLVYLTPGGGFSFIFTISLYFGALFTIPVAIYHLFRFLQPIMGKTSAKFAAGFLLMSVVLATTGALFGYYVTIPAALNFLATFAGDAVTPSLTADSYLNFVVTYILGLALIFQLPLLLFIFDHVRPIPPGMLSSMQRFVIISATVLAALITPTPDAFNMAVVAVPIIVVYEIGAITVYARRKVRNRRQRITAAAAASAAAKARRDPYAIADEPLTDIISELSRPIAAVAQNPQNTTSQAATRSVGAAPSSPITRPTAPQTPVAASLQAKPSSSPSAMPLRSRNIDGFASAPRPRMNVQVPSRPVVQTRPAERPVQMSRRSVDGMVTA